MKTKNIEQTVTLSATPHQVYEALLNAKKHSAFTESTVKIQRRVGGAFTAFDGWITGYTLALIPNKLIIQAWRGKDWPKGWHSIVQFSLKKTGKKCKISLNHVGIPAGHQKSINEGWHAHYWKPMKKMFDR